MEQRILECLQNEPSSEHILPFFWQHGEEHSVLAEEIEAIQMCGIQEFCVESRTHEQFCEEKWWDDFGFILSEAKQRGMRVWLLDDKRFPTGYANGYIEKHPELRAIRLRYRYHDFIGPQADMAIVAERLLEEESYVSITAYRRQQNGNVMVEEGIDLMPMLVNGILWWDIPEGMWRINYVIRTRTHAPDRYHNYIDMLSAESCKAMLHAVYEPHFERFGSYFGNTFAGFFSDEPSFGNASHALHNIIGQQDMLLPWNDAIVSCIAAKTGMTEKKILLLLPALWQEVDGETAEVRVCYMDAVTEQYSRNFSWMLGDWCRAHGVMYIGHVIEDMNLHQRLGTGAGHFFRALDGQDMSGCDVVLNQITPGKTEIDYAYASSLKASDPAFFNYTLAKLASSHSHINPHMKNRALCEVFGACGWAEGLPMMKYIVDLMLVSGINYFVPHAFNPKDPDSDCPPFFYASGNNCQFPLFGDLMRYLARSAYAMSGGIHQADVAVYYNAEAEWAGGKYMLQQEVCRTLTRAQLDFDLIPQDTLIKASVENKRLVVNEETYGAIIVPYSQYLPQAVLSSFERLEANGVPVIFINGFPDGFLTGEVKRLEDIAEYLVQKGCCHIRTAAPCPHLRFYHVCRNGQDVYLFWNEDSFHEIDTTLLLHDEAILYDVWHNQVFSPEKVDGGIRLKLFPAQALIVCVGQAVDGAKLPLYDYADNLLCSISEDWDISIRHAGTTEFVPYKHGALGNLAKELPDFAGVIRYETKLTMHTADDIHLLELGRVGEVASVWINDEYVGAEIAAPYRLDVQGRLHNGENTLRIEIMNNLGYQNRDGFSWFLPLPPTGLIGPVKMG